MDKNRKLKILYVSHAVEDEGGAEISLKTFATQFKQNGHQVVYAALGTYPGFHTHVFKRFRPIYTFELYEWYLSNFLCKVIRKEKPDVIHANDRFSIIPAIIAAKKEGVPIVVNFRDFSLMITTWGIPYSKKTGYLKSFGLFDVFRTSSLKRWLWELYKYLYIRRRYEIINQADVRLCISYAVKEWADKQGIRDSVVIHNAIELKLPKNLLSREAIRKEWNIPQDASVISYFSEFNLGKGVDMLFKIIERSDKIRNNPYFLIIGKGQEQDRVINLSKMNKNVIYLGGRIPHNEMYRAFVASDVVLMPSKNEPFSRLVVESHSMRIPVISSNKGGGKEVIVNGKTGLIVEAENIEDWINAINHIIKNKKHFDKFKSVAKKVAKEYSQKNAFLDIYKIYSMAINREKPRSLR